MVVFLLHVFLGILLFFIINWIGKHSYSIGYMEISLFVKVEDAPALNFLIRVLTPIVYLILLSAILYYFGLDKFVKNIFFVNIYYLLFRLIFNLATNRGLLLNWYRQLLYWITIITISLFTYHKLIKIKTNILPDFTTIANELWIIILVFIFHVANNIRFSSDGSLKRKQKYFKRRYNYFKNLYGHIIIEITQNEILEALIYSIIIYEDFNRPKPVRVIENIQLKLSKKPHTIGVMQVRSEKVISDKESVILGTNKVVTSYKKYLKENENKDFFGYSALSEIVTDYNGGESYHSEIMQLFNNIKEEFYKDTLDSLTLDKNVNTIVIE